MLNRLSIHLSNLVLLGVAAIAWLAPVPATAQTDTVNICDRTPQVEAAILDAINPSPACEAVPEADMAAITFLRLSQSDIRSLASGDFAGLSALESLSLWGNDLTTPPAGVFDGLSVLDELRLSNNPFSPSIGLPAGVFDDVPTSTFIVFEDSTRRAHFVCSRADADAIVAATAGVDDCLRITSAQFNAALTANAVTANDQLTDAINALDIADDGVISPDLLERINNVLDTARR